MTYSSIMHYFVLFLLPDGVNITVNIVDHHYKKDLSQVSLFFVFFMAVFLRFIYYFLSFRTQVWY